MSDRPDRFFKWVWRVNGVLLLLLALAGLAAVAATAISVAFSERRDTPEERVANVAGTDLRSQDARLGDFAKIAGTELLYAPLTEQSESYGSFYRDGRGAAQNLLFFDTATRKAHWLLAGEGQSIPSYSFLIDPPVCDGCRSSDCGAQGRLDTTLALLLEIQPRSSETNPGETRSLAVASPDGLSITKIAESTQGLLGHHQVSRDSVFVFYVKDGAARVLELDPVARVVKSDALLSAEK